MSASTWRGQLDADGLFFPQLELDLHPVLQERAGIAEQVGGKIDLLVRVLVHEHQHVAVLVEELVVLRVEPHLLDRVGAAEADIGLAAVLQVLHLDLHVGTALARLGVLDLGDLPDAAFIFENIAGTNVHAADFHGRPALGENADVRLRAPYKLASRGQGGAFVHDGASRPPGRRR